MGCESEWSGLSRVTEYRRRVDEVLTKI
jgi:hypothetical protein